MKLRTFAVGILAVALTGCAARVAHVTNLPPGVTEQQAKSYDTAVAGLHKIALTTTTLRQAVIDLHNAGAFDNDAAYATSLRAVAKIDEAQLAATSYLRDAPEYFGESQKMRIRGIFVSVLAEIHTLNGQGVTGIKNPDSLAKVNQLITELVGVVNVILSLT